MGSHPSTQWSPPQRFDGFELRGLIGQGGMGRVYLAHEEMLDRPVAIKFILGELGEQLSAPARERFMIEARAVARLAHANIVAVHRIGEVEGRLYVAYEYIAGRNLDERPGPATWQEVMRIGLGVARALAAAHSRGVLHRDVKPANIIEAESGEVKLVDFGLAKVHATAASAPAPPPAQAPAAADADDDDGAGATAGLPAGEPLGGRGGEDDADPDRTAPAHPRRPSAPSATDPAGARPVPGQGTITGTLLGTPLYFAPELWLGGRATPASDVFALGMVLHQLALGGHPHAGLAAPEIAQAVVSRDLPQVTESRPEFPKAVSRLIGRATLRKPDKRFSTGMELLAALESLDSVFSGFRSLSPTQGESTDEAGLVMASLARVSDRTDQLITAVYDELFARRPELRMLFPTDLKNQRAKLAAALRFVIENLRNPEHVVTALEELGQRHVGYGAKITDLSSLGDALLLALEAHDPRPWDEVTRKAWHAAYDSIAHAMSRGMQLASA
jgi:serine/threonine protein kinase